MNDMSYTVLKLTNGEDIICEVDFNKYDPTVSMPQRVFEIQNPLLMTATRQLGPDGINEGLSLSRWLQPLTEQKDFSIPASSVVTSATASPGLIRYYEHVLKKIDNDYIDNIITTENSSIKPTDDELEDILIEEEEEDFLSLQSPSRKIH
jgi:hypothetical protein